jgi:hypothetical protein
LRIDASPAAVLLDEQVRVRVRGTRPGEPVTIRAVVHDAQDRESTSSATFVADGSGAVDVASQAPVSGSYAGVDAMGLCWSMRPDREGGRSLPVDRNSTLPIRIALTAETAGACAACTAFERRWLAAGVRRERLTPELTSGLAGELFLPAGAGPFPAVLVLTGSGGGAPVGKAALLASRGLAALALGYFTTLGGRHSSTSSPWSTSSRRSSGCGGTRTSTARALASPGCRGRRHALPGLAGRHRPLRAA